jgi:hypothetical protein
MASENLVVGTSSNSNDGDTLRGAFIKVKKMFADMYGETYSEQGVMATTTFTTDVITQGAANKFLTDDSVTNAKLGAEYTASSALDNSGATVTVNASLGDVFTITAAASHTYSFTNVSLGDVKSLVITGSGGSYTTSFDTTSITFNRIGGTYSDASGVKNLIQIKFVSTTEAWYQISQPAT